MNVKTTIAVYPATRNLLIRYIDAKFDISKDISFDTGINQLLNDWQEMVKILQRKK